MSTLIGQLLVLPGVKSIASTPTAVKQGLEELSGEPPA